MADFVAPRGRDLVPLVDYGDTNVSLEGAKAIDISQIETGPKPGLSAFQETQILVAAGAVAVAVVIFFILPRIPRWLRGMREIAINSAARGVRMKRGIGKHAADIKREVVSRADQDRKPGS